MALDLDPRQRAMLQEMGITIWWPKPAAPAPVLASTPVQRVAVAEAPAPSAVAPTASVNAAPPVAPAPMSAPVEPQAQPRPAVPTTAAVPVPAASALHTAAAPSLEWRMAAPVQAYPQATGGSADDAWLVIWECATPHAPFEGDSGKLLNNMLRALRLHHSAHVWIVGLQRPGHEALPVAGLPAAPVQWQDLPHGLSVSLQQARPARILLLGMHAARAVLGSQEALGRLRAQVHQVQGIPTVVSYDPAYLLRSPHAKPAAWADLCRAHALRPPSAL